jgi:hypothetical protein
LARKAASNAGTGGIAISVHQLPQYGTRRLAAPQPRQRREAAFVGEARISSAPQPEYAGWGTLIRAGKYLLGTAAGLYNSAPAPPGTRTRNIGSSREQRAGGLHCSRAASAMTPRFRDERCDRIT